MNDRKSLGDSSQERGDRGERGEAPKRMKKLSEYGKQLQEKQKLKHAYGMRETQFCRFFKMAVSQPGVPGENLLALLERRLDNVLYRLKMAVSRAQSRQIIVHGHVLVNGKKVTIPSYLVSVDDKITLNKTVFDKKSFVENVVDKRLNMGIKVPEWLELNKAEHKGQVLRNPVRSDIQAPVEEYLIVELYSK